MSVYSDATLKPCPFCGGKAATGSIRYSQSPYADGLSEQLEYFSVNCVSCVATTRSVAGYPTESGAIAAWNARAPDPQLSSALSEIERLRAMIAECASTFAFYAECHQLGLVTSHKLRAKRNEAMEQKCRAALSSSHGGEG
jgi:Lar family restriction alleviation protein